MPLSARRGLQINMLNMVGYADINIVVELDGFGVW
jgi:hypothetical protein